MQDRTSSKNSSKSQKLILQKSTIFPEVPSRQPTNPKNQFKTVLDSDNLPSIHLTREIEKMKHEIKTTKAPENIENNLEQITQISDTPPQTTKIDIPKLPLHESFKITVGGIARDRTNSKNSENNLNVMDEVVHALVKPVLCDVFDKMVLKNQRKFSAFLNIFSSARVFQHFPRLQQIQCTGTQSSVRSTQLWILRK